VNGDQGDNASTDAGAAYLFTRSGTSWSQAAYLKASNPDPSDSFGWSVAVSGDLAVVGANGEDSSATGVGGDQGDNGALTAGAAYVFDLAAPEPDPFTPVCFGDGSGAPCGCGNESNAGSMSGCLNSVSIGGSGAILTASGTASVSAPNLTLEVSGVLTQPGLFFQAVNVFGGGSGLSFGDGLRCCGGSVLRLALDNPPPGPEPVSTATTLNTASGIAPGESRCYQYWYRDPSGPCSTRFNLSSAVRVDWSS
jgi:hypothetical protein